MARAPAATAAAGGVVVAVEGLLPLPAVEREPDTVVLVAVVPAFDDVSAAAFSSFHGRAEKGSVVERSLPAASYIRDVSSPDIWPMAVKCQAEFCGREVRDKTVGRLVSWHRRHVGPRREMTCKNTAKKKRMAGRTKNWRDV